VHIEILTNQSRAVNDLAKRVSDIAINTDNAMRKGLEEIQGLFKKVLSDVEDSTKKSFNTLDAEMEKELETAIRRLGAKLASVAAKLVEDYQNLGDHINKLVAIAENRIGRLGDD
jgi:hypothetical protein